ncbi:hypothetical protein A7P53_01350 [Acinetobacter defluvii]|uniref:hypothetical protein n=1 Tax=Acinetobacter defluvii TaxID=1871111 RepID=UPI00148FBBC8|nr:hypothetical protein [Acinetobacter defluvii]NNP74011.1 hypothetical protein [Acinetobacter defluvii]
MQTLKVYGLTYNWTTYKTLNFKEIHGLNFDNDEIEVLEIQSPDCDFHIVIRIDTHKYLRLSENYNWLKKILRCPKHHSIYIRYLMSMLILGTYFSKKYHITQTGIRLYLARHRVCHIGEGEIENKHIEKLIQFINSDRFKPYITNSSGTAILREASENEVIQILSI